MQLQTIIEAPWRYEKIFSCLLRKEEINFASLKGFDNRDSLNALITELTHWSTKSIFEDPTQDISLDY